ncbi:hypothetical protein ANN_02533, partial [Periplaneta americana]
GSNRDAYPCTSQGLALLFFKSNGGIDDVAIRISVQPIRYWTFGHQEQPGQFQRVRDSLRRRLEECIAKNGLHIEHLLRISVQISESMCCGTHVY